MLADFHRRVADLERQKPSTKKDLEMSEPRPLTVTPLAGVPVGDQAEAVFRSQATVLAGVTVSAAMEAYVTKGRESAREGTSGGR